MKTDELITLLGRNFDEELSIRPRIGPAIVAASLVGGAGVLALVLLFLGFRPDLGHSRAVSFVIFKIAFGGAIAGIAIYYLVRAGRPGGERSIRLAFASLPFLAVMAGAAGSLSLAPASHWDEMVVGDMWLTCLISIPVIAVAPFTALVWMVRRTCSPTDLVRAGALTGLAAGGLSAVGYAFHCVDDTLPFVALWYSATIVFCTLAGALLGPRLLRW